MNYKVDKKKKKKKQITKEISKKLGAKVLIPKVIWTMMFIVIAIATLGFVCIWIYNSLGEEWDTLVLLITFAVLIIPAFGLLAAIIPLCLRSYILRKYMMPWVGLKDEEIVFDDEMITHRFENIFWQGYMEKYWWSLYIRYRQVVRIEYDEVQRMLRVYGPRGSKKWHDPYYEQYISKVGANPEWKDETWIEIPEYFENFEEIASNISKMTGLPIINKLRPFETYK